MGNLIKIVEYSRNNALKKVNEELIRMYWSVGEYLSKEAENAAFGDAYIDSVVKEIHHCSNHLAIKSKAKTAEERHFFVLLKMMK